MSEELRHNGRHALAFDRAWLVSHRNPPWLKGPKENPAGSVAYVFGERPPHFPMPALWDKYPDQEYLVMMYERAMLVQELRDLQQQPQH